MQPEIINVFCGEVGIGNHHPIRLQSMCNTNIMHMEDTLQQCVALAGEGCELIRIACPGVKEAEQLGEISKEFRSHGYDTPLIADIHFNPKAAETAARIAEKIRINPGNYTERQYDPLKLGFESARDESMVVAREKLRKLVEICKDHGTVIRVGVNQGSLSQRILYKYGDTAQGMLESVIEYIDLFESLGFYNLVLSLKSSDIANNTEANRLTYREMLSRGRLYPLHLGITEAGGGMDGIMKSVAGIGTLLSQGIGDTIRVSLTGDPVKEIPVGRKLIDCYGRPENINDGSYFIPETNSAASFKGYETPHMIISSINPGQRHKAHLQKPSKSPSPTADLELVPEAEKSSEEIPFAFPGNEDLCKYKPDNVKYIFINSRIDHGSIKDKIEEIKFTSALPLMITDKISGKDDILAIRRQIKNLHPAICGVPVLANILYSGNDIDQAIMLSPLFVNNIVQGIWLDSKTRQQADKAIDFSFRLLQATGKRISTIEFIGCPTCGRSNFDVEKVLESIKHETKGMKGIRIAVMGCIVNGPGEMRDADYGYVGAGNGLVSLYRKQVVIEKNIPESEAVEKLLEAIRKDHKS